MCYAELAVQFLVYINQIAHIQESTKVTQYTTAYGGEFFETSFDMIIEHKMMILNNSIACNLEYM